MCIVHILFFKQKTAYEMRISDWSSDVCSSDLGMDASTPLRWRTSCSPSMISHEAPTLRAEPHVPRLVCRGALCHLRRPARGGEPHAPVAARAEIGRASCRERVCQSV